MCPFRSILFLDADRPLRHDAPDFFHDLNLDQIADAVAGSRREYDLAPFFYTALDDLDAISYRQEVLRDLEDEACVGSMEALSSGMRIMRDHLRMMEESYYVYEKERWFLAAAEAYCAAVIGLADDLRALAPRSRGLRAWREYLASYIASASFTALRLDASRVAAGLSSVRYDLLIRDGRITVLPHGGGTDHTTDYTAAVSSVFAKFRSGAGKKRAIESGPRHLNHVEAQILDYVARLEAGVFAALDEFFAKHAGYEDDTIVRSEREIQFYLAYLEYIERCRHAGLDFCHARLSATSKEIGGRGMFDLALASVLVKDRATVVRNDFFLRGEERLFVVTGPNHGGKTTFARTFGQLHYLARLGLPVPGSEARLFLYDELFTHFEREEDATTLRGRLQDDLIRMRRILDRATSRSIVIINEMFASTTLRDARFLSERILAEISRLDLIAVCVTFLDELSTFDAKTVSMVSAVDPADPAARSFSFERRPADGLAYALAIAEKYRVTYEWLKRRIAA